MNKGRKDPRNKLELQKLKLSAQNHLTSWQKLQSPPSFSSLPTLSHADVPHHLVTTGLNPISQAAHAELFTEYTAVSGGIHGNMGVIEIFHRRLSQAICPSSRPLLCTQDDCATYKLPITPNCLKIVPVRSSWPALWRIQMITSRSGGR